MYIDLNIFVILIWSIVFLAVIVAILVMYLFKLYRGLRHIQNEEVKLDHKLHEKTSEVMEHAFSKADHMIDEANQSALDIEHQATLDANKYLGSELQKGLQQLLKETAATMRQEMASHISQFSKDLSAEYLLAEKKLNDDISQRKQDKLVEFDQQVSEAVMNLSHQILGKTISISQHEELVKEALAKAKKELF